MKGRVTGGVPAEEKPSSSVVEDQAMTTRREDPEFIGPEIDRRHASPFWLIGVLEGTLRSHRSGIRTAARAMRDLETGLLVHDVARTAYPGER